VPESEQVHLTELVAGEVELGDAEVARGTARGAADRRGLGELYATLEHLGDVDPPVDVVEGERLQDGPVAERLLPEQRIGAVGEVEAGRGRGKYGGGLCR